jgi:hypothetical protein
VSNTGRCFAAIITRYVATRAVLATASHEQDDKPQGYDESDDPKHLHPARHPAGRSGVGLSHVHLSSLCVPAGASNLYKDDSLYENSVSRSNQYVAVPP